MNRLPFLTWLAIGLCVSLLWACTASLIPSTAIDSFESADRYLQQELLSKISVDSQMVSDTDSYRVAIPPLVDSIPDPATYPLYGAQPTTDPTIAYAEIYSSAEKANGERADERWLIDVVERFNQQQQRLPSGEIVQVGIRNIPSGLGAQMLAAGKGKPAGYTPAHGLWLKILEAEGVATESIAPALVPNQAILALHPQLYQTLAQEGNVTFDRVLNAILAGNLKVGYSNPYIASSALNFLYTLLWQAAGHRQDGNPLILADLESPAISSVFNTFQQQIKVTTPTYLDLRQIWQRDPQTFDVIIMARQSYVNLKQQPGFDQLAAVPFGLPEDSPLVAFDWTTPLERDALTQFAAFATSAPMQQLARQQGFEPPEQSPEETPPLPSGEVLQAAQALWKQRKDGGHTVYMNLVVDTSGSMEENDRLKAVQNALRLASQQINRGNQIGLLTFSDRPVRRIHLSPFTEIEQKRLFVAIDALKADGATALYDALAVGLADLMEQQKTDPEGRFYLLLLTDGERTDGLQLDQLQDVIRYSNVRIYPIAYGEVNQQELEAIAAIREGTVYEGTPERVQTLLKDLFQTSL